MQRTPVLLLSSVLLLGACGQAAGPSGLSSSSALASSIAPGPAAASATSTVVPAASSPAGSPPPPPSTAPTPSAPPTPATASQAPRAPVVLAVGEHARVITDNLRRRSKPEVSATSEIRGILQAGAKLWVLGGPVEGSGYWWYRVAIADPTGVESAPDKGIGWVAAADRDGTPWIVAQPFANAVDRNALVWSSTGSTVPTEATFTLPGGAPHIIFSGVEGCVYRVQFGKDLEYDMGFMGAQLSTVKWPGGPEPSMATWGQGTGVTAMPELPAGTYRLVVSNTGAPMLLKPTSLDYPCPWGLAITP